MRLILLATALVGLLALTACGIRGPLYLPEVPPAAGATAPVAMIDHSKPAQTDRT